MKIREDIASALNRTQDKSVTLASTVSVWKKIKRTVQDEAATLEKYQKRYQKCIKPLWLLAYALHPCYIGENLVPEERRLCSQLVCEKFPECSGSFSNFLCA